MCIKKLAVASLVQHTTDY